MGLSLSSMGGTCRTKLYRAGRLVPRLDDKHVSEPYPDGTMSQRRMDLFTSRSASLTAGQMVFV